MRYLLLIIVMPIIMSGSAEANLWGHSLTDSIVLEKEQVAVEIKGAKATVIGTFMFTMRKTRDRSKGYHLFLPVYASPDTDPASIKVTIGVPMDAGDGQDLLEPDHTPPVRTLLLTHWRKPPFEEMPTVKGQRPFWFKAYVAKSDLKGSKMLVKIFYEQTLSDGVFIYTPIIPDQLANHDYGTISVSADRPIEVMEKKRLQMSKENNDLAFKPVHKQAIIVRAAAGKD